MALKPFPSTETKTTREKGFKISENNFIIINVGFLE